MRRSCDPQYPRNPGPGGPAETSPSLTAVAIRARAHPRPAAHILPIHHQTPIWHSRRGQVWLTPNRYQPCGPGELASKEVRTCAPCRTGRLELWTAPRAAQALNRDRLGPGGTEGMTHTAHQ